MDGTIDKFFDLLFGHVATPYLRFPLRPFKEPPREMLPHGLDRQITDGLPSDRAADSIAARSSSGF